MELEINEHARKANIKFITLSISTSVTRQGAYHFGPLVSPRSDQLGKLLLCNKLAKVQCLPTTDEFVMCLEGDIVPRLWFKEVGCRLTEECASLPLGPSTPGDDAEFLASQLSSTRKQALTTCL